MSSSASRPTAARRRNGVVAAVLLALVVVLYGGYAHHWPWTGINGRTATLWDWLHLLLLPLAVAVLPLWASQRTQVDRRSKSFALALTTVFAMMVIAGYTIPWAWTGFQGNRLWDWLNLIALPLAVALTPIAGELRESWSRRYSMVALAGTLTFVALVAAGYLAPWRWTGFTGNTLWDWLHLLLLPLLLPAVVVPALMPVVNARMVTLEEEVDEAVAAEGEADAVASGERAPAPSRADSPSAPDSPGSSTLPNL